ncbi:uncharacterized protein LOC129588601 [Paramacrobiotus metropolitanus]|uniref:uncharacterized protein LOC129588601 n=1 Tax=Paramacrobiotus metropolitanus TaxID=2943436 RepID=UPI0024456560|nr:uncharacterized protein LOC129588601 [Paramacrobiotus metropolitanus]
MCDCNPLITIYRYSFVGVVQCQNLVSEDRPVSRFYQITSSGPFNVTIAMGKTEGLTIEASQEIIGYVQTVVEGLALNLRFAPDLPTNISTTDPINISINAKIITNLVSSGTGPITFSTPWKAKDVQIILSGTGDITAPVNLNNVNAVLSGTGNVNINGKCKNVNISASGIGAFNGADLHAQQVNVAIYASSVVSIYVENGLSAWIPGSGQVIYGGSPQVNQQITGSGSVMRADQVE